jgi:hypothetical protein
MRMIEYEFRAPFSSYALFEDDEARPRARKDAGVQTSEPRIGETSPRLPVHICTLAILSLSPAGYAALFAVAGALAHFVRAF